MVERTFYGKNSKPKMETPPTSRLVNGSSTWDESRPIGDIEPVENLQLMPLKDLESTIGVILGSNSLDVKRLEKAAIAQRTHPTALPKYLGVNESNYPLKVSMGNLDQAYSIWDPKDHLRFFYDFDMWRTGLYLFLPVVYGGVHLTA
jgi:hypothetical protein